MYVRTSFVEGDDLNLTDDRLARLLEHTIVFFGFSTLILVLFSLIDSEFSWKLWGL